MKLVQHSLRKLTLADKTKLLTMEFGIEESLIEKIRNIPDIEKRFLKAAKMQYEIFGTTHNDLTAWMSGYASESSVRKHFGSLQDFRLAAFPGMQNKVPACFSQEDIRRNIKLPIEMSSELAEETGIHIGDGNLQISKGTDGPKYRYRITGDLINEALYHETYILPLLRKVYNSPGKLHYQKDKNSVITTVNSKAVALYKNKTLSLPVGSKKNIIIPRQILRNECFQKFCLKGIIDTDFTMTQDGQLVGNLASLSLLKQMSCLLKNLKIEHKLYLQEFCGRLTIYKRGATQIFEEWQLNNQKHTSKYKILKETGKYIPFTTTLERLAFLKGDIDLEMLMIISKQRRENT